MNFRFKSINDEKIWNNFIIQYNNFSFFQCYEWGLVQQLLNQKVIRIGIHDEDKLVGIVQIVIVKAKRGTFVHLRHGPVLIPELFHSYPLWNELIKYLVSIAESENAWFIRISPMIDADDSLKLLFKKLNFQPSPIQSMDAELCWILNLDATEEQLLGGMRKTTRYLIRKAEKIEIEVKESNDIERFLKLYKTTYQRQGFFPHLGIKEEYNVFSKNQNATLLFASYKKNLLAAALIIFFGNQAIYHHGASTASKIPASYYLQWQGILAAKKRGVNIYNFWGIAPNNSPRHPWVGLSLFKKGFGGSEKQFLHAQDLAISPYYLISSSIETARKWWKGY